MDVDQDQVYKGHLLLLTSGKILIKKTWQQKFCFLYKASKSGIGRLEVWDTPDKTKGVPLRIITLDNCVKISSDNPTEFTITTKTAPFVYKFNASTIEAKSKWLSALQSIAFPDDISLLTSIEEDNDLYCSSGEGVFNVKIYPSQASERCGLNNQMYTLLLTSSAIQLQSASDGKLLYTWPYCFIRRYGCKNGKFTFEAGRMCESGEGTFFVEHPNRQEIFRCLSLKMEFIKKLLKQESSNSNPILDCGENQLHAALSMEARSRSPLPPSPTTSTVESQDSSKKICAKPKPAKPPRKSLPAKPIEKSDNYEPLSKYDSVEYRSDAWRTLGVNEVKHTENSVEDDEEYLSWGGPKAMLNPNLTLESAKIITEDATLDDDSYDKLNFFGSSSKLNVKSGYKQISLASGASLPSPPSYNDYDEVQPALEGIRLADDSHLGYALVRKEAPPPPRDVAITDNSNVNHQFHNNEPYAVISKPKRV